MIRFDYLHHLLDPLKTNNNQNVSGNGMEDFGKKQLFYWKCIPSSENTSSK
ncbi:hypothetical protein LINPERPRIM_LOCUS1555 [Linum perenne]